MSIELIEDTDTVLAELSSRIGRLINLEYEVEKRAKAKADQHNTCRHNCEWISKLIKFAEAGRRLEWVEGSIDDLQDPDFRAEQLIGVPPHIIKHAIALAKQAIANQTPATV